MQINLCKSIYRENQFLLKINSDFRTQSFKSEAAFGDQTFFLRILFVPTVFVVFTHLHFMFQYILFCCFGICWFSCFCFSFRGFQILVFVEFYVFIEYFEVSCKEVVWSLVFVVFKFRFTFWKEFVFVTLFISDLPKALGKEICLLLRGKKFKKKLKKKSKNRRSRWGRKTKKTGTIFEDFSGFLRIFAAPT